MNLAKPVTLVTRSPRMRDILDRVDTIAASNGTVLLVGETGVGKELFADYIHRVSPRVDRPLVKIALSAIPHELLESELFGHEKGSFTHALNEKRGLFELADGGTLFLDDIDDVPPAMQAKLVRALETHEIKRVGGTVNIPIDVRLITASKVDLKELVGLGKFRADLLYRINVIPVEIPPLRQRSEDIPLLTEYFLGRFAPDRELRLSPDAAQAMQRYPWPGNVRELRNIAQRLALFSRGEIGLDELPEELRLPHPVTQLVAACTRCMEEHSMPFHEVVDCLEQNLLRKALHDSGGNQSQAARALGLSLSTLRDKLHKHGIELPH